MKCANSNPAVLFLVLYLGSAEISLGQINQFNREYDLDLSNDIPADLIVDDDRLVTVGFSSDSDGQVYYLRFVSLGGEEIGTHIYSSPDTSFLSNEVLRTSDSTLMIMGVQWANGTTEQNFYATCVDEEGNFKWSKNYEDINDLCSVLDAVQIEDAVYMSGWARGISAVQTVPYVKKIDLEGNEIWSLKLKEDQAASTRSMIALDDTLYALSHTLGENKIPRVFVVDTEGSILREEVYHSLTSMPPNDLHYDPTNSQFYIVGSEGTDPKLLVLDRDLSLVASESYPSGEFGAYRSVGSTAEGKIVALGYGENSAHEPWLANVFVDIIDPDNFELISRYWYSPSGNLADGSYQIALELTATESNIYTLTSSQPGWHTGTNDEWVLALDRNGVCDTASCFPWLITGISEPAEQPKARLFVDGASSELVAIIDEAYVRQGDCELHVYSILGKLLIQESLREGVTRFELPSAEHVVVGSIAAGEEVLVGTTLVVGR